MIVCSFQTQVVQEQRSLLICCFEVQPLCRQGLSFNKGFKLNDCPKTPNLYKFFVFRRPEWVTPLTLYSSLPKISHFSQLSVLFLNIINIGGSKKFFMEVNWYDVKCDDKRRKLKILIYYLTTGNVMSISKIIMMSAWDVADDASHCVEYQIPFNSLRFFKSETIDSSMSAKT